MSLIFHDPFFTELERALDNSFDRALGRQMVPAAPTANRSPRNEGTLNRALAPLMHGVHAFDVVEHKDKFELVADAPGMTPEDIKVELHEGTLTVTGSHGEAKYVEEPAAAQEGGEVRPKVLRSERRTYQFTRTFVLPENVDPEAITAALDRGVLSVSIPKVPQAPKPQPKRISVVATPPAA